MTPKSLLRSPDAASPLGDFERGSFRPVLIDEYEQKQGGTLVVCSGKVFYDIDRALTKEKSSNVTVARLEQLYPFAHDELAALKARIKPKKCIWVQEEPENMGGWRHMRARLEALFGSVAYIGRSESSSTSTGSAKRHQFEQQMIMSELVAASRLS